MWAIVDGVHLGIFCGESCAHVLMDGGQAGFRIKSGSNPTLVGDNDDANTQLIQGSNCSRSPIQHLKQAGRSHPVAFRHLAIEDTIAIQEDKPHPFAEILRSFSHI